MPIASTTLRAPHAAFGIATVVACLFTATSARAAPKPRWEESPYRIHLTLSADTSARPQADFEASLRTAILDRAASAVGPLWSLNVQIAADPATRRFSRDPRDLDWAALPAKRKQYDKLMWLAVVAQPQGYALSCREFDVFTQRWGPRHVRLVPQRRFVGEAAFQLLVESFSPVALVRALGEKDQRVQLVFRGGALPLKSTAELFVAPGDPYLPLLRRSDRSGQLAKNGLTEIPWTLLTAAEPDAQGWLADIHSGMRNPFLAKRRGLVEQVAVSLNYPRGPSRVRFHARSDAKQGLAGYEVFRELLGKPPLKVGVTDRDGTILVPPGDAAVSSLLLRSDGAMLARLPVVAGSPEVIQAAIADDEVRLQAQSEARVVREELIDVVARRAIMMARIRAMLKAGKVDEARQLMTELDELPSASTFAGKMNATARRLPKSADPQVQKSIERLFDTTRELLSRFLDPRAITTLQNEVNAAGNGGS